MLHDDQIMLVIDMAKYVFGSRLYVPVNNFSVISGCFPQVEPVLSNEDEVSCSRTQNHAPGGIRTHDLAIKSPALYQLS